jgi:pyruvate/2-oxoglutarate dehydrogenase complex dihydrolipoamide acyltransferase (E2) component
MHGSVSTVRRPVLMPSVEVGMEDGRLVAFLVDLGAIVSVGQPLFTVEADKVTMDIEAPVAGSVVEFVAEPGTDVAVGAEVLVLKVAR